jgi:hypothetical protein
MSHPEKHHVFVEFVEEYWIIFFFGSLFLTMAFIPLLMLESKIWFFAGLATAITVVVTLVLTYLKCNKA